MTTHTVTGQFPSGTTGTVLFRRKEWLTSVSEGTIPAADVVETIEEDEVVATLRATSEDGVSPDFMYWVYLRLDGHDEMVGRMTLTADSDLSEVFQWETPPTPEMFVPRSEFEALQTALGDPASAADLEALEAVVDQDIADLSDEVERATTAEGLLDARLDTAETDITDLQADIVTLQAQVTELLARGYVVNTDEEDATIFIGETDPDPDFDPQEGSLWIDSTEAP